MTNSLITRIQSLLSKIHSVVSGQPSADSSGFPPSGLHHYIRETPDARSRIHLRVDPDGHGTLIVNANQVVHLNPTATLMAFFALEEIEENQTIRQVQRHYQVSEQQALADYAQFVSDLEIILQPNGCPACTLDELEIAAPFSARPMAPYRMDLALTYRCNDDCAHCYNARPRDYPELPTEAWKRVIDRCWALSIPHIVFTGGEPTLRDDLPKLIAHAEANGQITGVNTNARRLSDPYFVEALIKSGLDHIQITVESHEAKIHDQMVGKQGAWQQTIAGLRNVLDSSLFVMTNTTMLQDNYTSLSETLDFLAEFGVPTVGLNALIYSGRGLSVGTGLKESQLPPLLDLARQKTQANDQRLIWYTPTQYCQFDPMQFDLGVKGCTAALYNMCVEPDGGVIPFQSYYHQLGNILNDPWDSIWNHSLSKSIRERDYIPEACADCAVLGECGGGCPLALEASHAAVIPIETIELIS